MLLILLYFYTFLNLNGSFKIKILIPLLSFSNLFIINVFISFIFISLNVKPEIFMSNMSPEYFIITIFQKLILVFEYLFLKRYKNHDIYISNKTWIYCTILILISMFFPILIFTQYLLHNITELYIVNVAMLNFIAINSLIYILLLKMNQDHNKILEQSILIESQKREQRILNLIDQKIEALNKLNHDFNNHKLVIEKMIENQENNQINEYVKEIFPTSSHTYMSSSNTVLDYILEEKIQSAKNNDIDIKCLIQGDLHHTIAPVDLSIVIGNLMDNAIEATLKCSHKYISINIYQNHSQLIIKVSNTYNGTIRKKRKKLETTKPDKMNHGYGITNIETICKKYNGYNHITYDDKIFTHTCVFLLP